MPTIKDVARLAEVSICTVSEVLNHHPKAAKIRETTRERIYAAAAELGYRPSQAGRNFRLKRSFLVALVVDDIAHDFWFGLVRAVADELGSGFNVIVCNTNGNPDEEKRELENLTARNVDAVILLQCAASEERHLEALNRVCPLVLLEASDNPELSFIKGDDYRSGYELLERAVADGHRRIAFLTNPALKPGPMSRLEGARAAAALHPDVALENICVELTEESFREKFLPRAGEFSLALCVDDSLAGFLLKLLPEAGIRIPEDLSLVGWNDSAFLRYLSPPLASVAIPLREVGRRAARLILRRLNGENMVEKDLLKEEFIVRQSYRSFAPQNKK